MLCVKKMRDMIAKLQDGYQKNQCNACESKMMHEKKFGQKLRN